MLQKLQFRPGVLRDVTNYSAEGTWWDCDKVRFRGGYPEKIGGWRRSAAGYTDLVGIARHLFCWVPQSPQRYLTGVGTSRRYYIEMGNTWYDVTPITSTTTVANPFTTNLTNPTQVNVAWTGHAMAAGDELVISGATGFNGLVTAELNGTHTVHVVDANNLTINLTTPATAAGSGGGASVTLSSLLTNVNDDTSYVGGWGGGAWGAGPWGSGRASENPTAMATRWSADSFGSDLVANRRGGAVYYWAYNSGSGASSRMITLQAYAAAIASPANPAWIPVVCNSVLVAATNSAVLAFGCNQSNTSTTLDPMFVRWSDSSNPVDWEPKVTNAAGGIRLSAGSQIVTAVRTRNDILIFTDTAVYSMQYVGGDLVYSFQVLYEATSIASPTAVVVHNGVAYWMSKDKFYAYDGSLTILPCTVRAKVFGELNLRFTDSICAGVNPEFNEITWFYPNYNSSNNNTYVTYNFIDQVWYFGTMQRSVWQNQTYRGQPYAAAWSTTTNEWGELRYTSQIVVHEVGTDDLTLTNPTAISSFIESADFDIGEGHHYGIATKMIPDVRFDGSVGANSVLTLTLYPRTEPGADYAAEPTNAVIERSLTVDRFTRQIDIRLRGRQLKIRLESTGQGVAWKLGTPRIDLRQDGRRA